MTTSITSSTTQTIISAGGNPSALVIENGGIVSGIGKNKIINGNFAINQRGVSGTVVLAAGAYGHDRFKAGAAGCTYTFATLENITTITISAGSLIQVIEGLNLFSGNVVLSWEGTAQGKIGAGAYGNSGVTGTAVGGTNLSVEFGTGTLSLVQLETGSYKSAFEHRPYGMELSLCQRYFQKSFSQSVAPQNYASDNGSVQVSVMAGQDTQIYIPLPVEMMEISSPLVTLYATASGTTAGQWYGTAYGSTPGDRGSSTAARSFWHSTRGFAIDNGDVGATYTGWAGIHYSITAEL